MIALEVVQLVLDIVFIVVFSVLLVLLLRLARLKLIQRGLNRKLKALQRKQEFAITNNGEAP